MPPIMAAAAARIMIIIAVATAFFVVISAAAVFLMIFIAAATGIVVAAWHGAATTWSMAAIVVVAAAAAIVVVAATITTVMSAAATITSTCVNKTEGIPRSEFDQVAIIYLGVSLPQSATRTLFGVLFHQIGRLKELESENARLKKIVAQQALDIDALKELLRKSGRKRLILNASQPRFLLRSSKIIPARVPMRVEALEVTGGTCPTTGGRDLPVG